MSILLDALKKSQKDQQEVAQAAAETAAKEVTSKPSMPMLATASEPAPAPEPFIIRDENPATTFKFTSLIFPSVCVLLAAILYVGFGSRGEKESSSVVSVSPVGSVQPENPSKSETIATPMATSQLPKVEGIVWDPDAPLAILAGKPVKVGDSAEGWKVQSISANQVNISRDGVTETLTLPEIPATNRDFATRT